MIRLTKKKNNTNAKKRSILRLLSAPVRYIKHKINSIYKELMKKEPKKTFEAPNISENEETLKRKSIDELKEIAKLRGIKNRGKLKKGLITNPLKSESRNAECNYTNVGINTTNNNDDTYDGKIRDIRGILSRLENVITKNDQKKIKKELYEIENKKNLSDKEKEKIYDRLVELLRTLDKKEKYKHHDRDDLDYHGISDIENLFDNIDDDYYKPILVKSCFKKDYKYHESRGDKDKKLSVKQYLDMIIPYLSDLINENKAIENNFNESKIQRNIHVNFVSSNDSGEICTIFVLSDNE